MKTFDFERKNRQPVKTAPTQEVQAIPDVNVHVHTYEAEPAPPQPLLQRWYAMGLAMNAKGDAPIYNTDNIIRSFEADEEFKNKIWFDEFHGRIFTTWNGKKRKWSDAERYLIFAHLQRHYGLSRITLNMVDAAIEAYALKDIRNEPKDYISGLAWDGERRVQSSLIQYFGAEDSLYARQVAENFWISLVARIFEPGCKVDNMVVLEGGQGKFKSTALSVIAQPWFTETNETPNNKDFYLIMNGNILVEIAELDSFSRADRLTVKKTLSCRVDRFRAPYDRYVRDNPRQCIFAGTTNEDTYLDDPTGARRFWPIKTGAINIPLLRADREQLFAEALWRYKQGFTWWEVPEAAAKAAQESRRIVDLWEDAVTEYMAHANHPSTNEILEECLGMRVGAVDHRSSRRLTRILKTLGYERVTVRKLTGFVKGWKKSDSPHEEKSPYTSTTTAHNINQ